MNYDPAQTQRDKPRRSSLPSYQLALDNYRRGSITSLHTTDPGSVPVARRASELTPQKSEPAAVPRKRAGTTAVPAKERRGSAAPTLLLHRRISVVPPVRTASSAGLAPLNEVAETLPATDLQGSLTEKAAPQDHAAPTSHAIESDEVSEVKSEAQRELPATSKGGETPRRASMMKKALRMFN
ncbi:unnamed protein product [Parajaminaea phylloscopi]